MRCSESIPDPWLVDTSFACVAAYKICQDDIDVGSVSNTVRYEAMQGSVDKVDGIVFLFRTLSGKRGHLLLLFSLRQS